MDVPKISYTHLDWELDIVFATALALGHFGNFLK